MAWCRGLAGVGERGMYTSGSPRNLGDPVVSTTRSGAGNPESKPWRHVEALVDVCERTGERRVVSRSEGNEAKRDGRQEVGAPNMTDEAGEPTQGTPRRKGGAGLWNRRRERPWERRVPQASQRNCNG